MRIAVFIKSTTFHKGHGGLETQNKLLCEGLVKRGHNVTVFTRKDTVELNEALENGVSYIFIPCSYRYLFSSLNPNSWLKKSVEYFETKHNKEPFDLVIGQSSAAVGIIKQKEYFGVKVLSIAHGTTLGEFITTFSNIKNINDVFHMLLNMQYVLRQYFGRQREYILKSNKVVAVSNAVKAALIEETYIPEQWVEVINNGIDPNNIPGYSPNGLRNFKGNDVLYVGQITKDKGIDILVNIFLTQNQNNSRLNVAGSGPLLESLKNIISTNNYGSKVNLLGKIPYEKIFNLYNDENICVFAFPTRRIEGFPMVLVEAMFAGLPVVAFNLGGVSDAVIDNVTGYLIDPDKKDVFAEKLFSLLDDKDKLKEFSMNAKNKAEKEFTVNAMLDKYEKVFGEVLK